MLGWLPVMAVIMAIAAMAAARHATDDAKPSDGRRALPYVLLLVAAVLAVLSTAAEAIVDSRVGIREVSTASLALLLATPSIGWLSARLRWGAPGRRTFHQQIAANRETSIVLLVLLVEVLAVTGFVVGATVGAVLGAALGLGLVAAAGSVVAGVVAAVIVSRRGPEVILEAVRAKPIDGQQAVVLRDVVAELSIAAHIEPPSLYLITDDGPNAFAVGTDPNRAAIAVTTGLLERLDREELQGVIAHEIAHIRNLDSRYGLLVAVIVGAVIILATAFATILSSGSIEADGLSGLILAIIIALLAAAIGFAVKLFATLAARAIQASVSREREFLADATSVELTRNPAGLIRALEVVGHGTVVSQASPSTQHLWFVTIAAAEDQASEEDSGWFSTHPSPEERIGRLRALIKKLSGTDVQLSEAEIAPAEA